MVGENTGLEDTLSGTESALTPASSGLLTKSLTVSVLSLSPLQNGNDNHTSLIELLQGFLLIGR